MAGSHSTNIGRNPQATTTYFLYALAAASFLGCYHSTLAWLVQRWFADPYLSGALVVLPIVAYLLWGTVKELPSLPARGTVLGWPFLIAGGLLHLLSTWIGYPHPSAISLVFLAFGVTLVVWGLPLFRRIWPILALLVFVTPMPQVMDPLTFPLRIISTKWAVALPTLAGIPCHAQGTTIYGPGFVLFVDIPCSGLRSIWALLFIASLLSAVLGLPALKTLFLLSLAFPLGLIENVLRIDTSILAGLLFGAKAAEGFYHTGSGMLCFLISVAILSLSALWLREAKWRIGSAS